jgi:hypothetical protein
MIHLNYDCAVRLAWHLDHRSISSLAQVSRFYTRVCNDDEVWNRKVYERLGRDVEGGRAMFCRSLKAGRIEVIPLNGPFMYVSHPGLQLDRRDIVKESVCIRCDLCYLACVTVDDRCLVSAPFDGELRDIGHTQRVGRSTEDACRAQDAIIHCESDSCWFVAILYNGELRVLSNGLDQVELPTLTGVKQLLSMDGRRATYVTCLLEDNSVVCVPCKSHSKVILIATGVANGFVLGIGALCWTYITDTKYIHVPHGMLSEELRIYLSNRQLVCSSYYSDEEGEDDVQLPTGVGEYFVPAYYEEYRLTRDGVEYQEDTDDVCVTDEGVVVVLSGGRLSYNSGEGWCDIATGVLWMRSTSMMKNCVVCIVEPR